MTDHPMPRWERRLRAPLPTFPAWSPQAPDRLVFPSNEDGSEQVYAHDLATGRTRKASDEPVGVTAGQPTADGSGVVWFSADHENARVEEATLEARKQELLKAQAEVHQQVLRLPEALAAETDRREALKRQVRNMQDAGANWKRHWRQTSRPRNERSSGRRKLPKTQDGEASWKRSLRKTNTLRHCCGRS